MDFPSSILPFQSHPIPHEVLISLLHDYKNPNDKVHRWLKEGRLIALKRGLYIWRDPRQPHPELFSIANTLYGPSYVSCESALSYYGMIPEQVYTVVSVTFKASRVFRNGLGDFEFVKIPKSVYPLGIRLIELREGQLTQIATLEKALLDKVITTPGLLFRSAKAASEFLLENMRMDEDQLKIFDTKQINLWAEYAPKKESIHFLTEAISRL